MPQIAPAKCECTYHYWNKATESYQCSVPPEDGTRCGCAFHWWNPQTKRYECAAPKLA